MTLDNSFYSDLGRFFAKRVILGSLVSAFAVNFPLELICKNLVSKIEDWCLRQAKPKIWCLRNLAISSRSPFILLLFLIFDWTSINFFRDNLWWLNSYEAQIIQISKSQNFQKLSAQAQTFSFWWKNTCTAQPLWNGFRKFHFGTFCVCLGGGGSANELC